MERAKMHLEKHGHFLPAEHFEPTDALRLFLRKSLAHAPFIDCVSADHPSRCGVAATSANFVAATNGPRQRIFLKQVCL